MSEALLNFMPEANALDGRVILVTGAGDGVGRAISKAYASCGATVVLLGKTIAKLEAVYDEITDQGFPEPAIYPLDMAGATAHDYLEMSKILSEQLGGLDGLVLNAAWMPSFMPFEQYDLESWQKVMTINLNANYLMIQACLPLLKQSKYASILHSAHYLTRAYAGAFGIAKAGMAAMLDIVADQRLSALYSQLGWQGAGNSQNTASQMAGVNLVEEAQMTLDTNSNGFFWERGTVGMTTWNEALNRRGSGSIGNNEGLFTTMVDPVFGVQLDMHVVRGIADTSASAGNVQDIVDEYEIALTYATEGAWLSTANETSIFKIVQANS